MAQQSTIGSTAATSYARALLGLADAQNQAREVGEELVGVGQVFDAEPAFASLVANPSVAPDARLPILTKAFEGRLSPLTWNFVRLLNAKGRLVDFRLIADAYDDLLDEKYGKVEVDVTVAERLDDAALEEVRRSVGEALNREAVIHQYVDESIIGGLVIRVQDKLIDTSVRAQLAAMKEQMLAARPRSATM